tara:strand:- start:666 stop:1169 length:504 start_codon:yes stop_codon:yes gene_type:complete
MKVLNNVLSEDLIQEISKELKNKIQSDSWGTSEVFWEPSLRLNSTGTVLISNCSDRIQKLLLSELENVLPEYSEVFVKYHLWQKGSAISCHQDMNYKFGATLYLNDVWDLNWGGIFVWKPNDSNTMKAIAPTHNTLVVNDESELHFVTPISYNTDTFRVTMQIFAPI